MDCLFKHTGSTSDLKDGNIRHTYLIIIFYSVHNKNILDIVFYIIFKCYYIIYN